MKKKPFARCLTRRRKKNGLNSKKRARILSLKSKKNSSKFMTKWSSKKLKKSSKHQRPKRKNMKRMLSNN